jgi:Holliday junction DNA helicase RuvA
VSTLISAIFGNLETKGVDFADISIGGITLRANISTKTSEDLGEVGRSVRLHTSLQVRQDQISLYGFSTEEDRITFDTLININGVGPRLALAILSTFTAGELSTVVNSEDSNTLTQVPGVGKRTASRILLELKGKVDQISDIITVDNKAQDVLAALTALGYSAQEARQAMANVPPNEDISGEDWIRIALQHLT